MKENKSVRSLRVVIIAPSIKYLIGGQEVQADLLLQSWRDDPALEISYVATNLQLPEWLSRIPYLRTIVRFPLYLMALALGLREADIAHIFSASFSSFLIATVPAFCISAILRKKIIINYHSGLARPHVGTSRIARRTLQEADMVVVPSTYLVEVFRELEVKAQAVPNLVDPHLFSYRIRDPLRPLLLCSRNLEPCYGINLVLQAFAEVQKSFPEARLCLIGEGSQEKKLRSLVAGLNLTGVEMTGRISRKEVGHFYDQAHIFVNASRVDNMPVSLLEAFASGLPVVTTDAGGIPDIVRHEQTGLLNAIDDWHQLAANIIRLLREPALAHRIVENAYQQSLAYHWGAVRQEWLRLYRELGDSGKSSQ